VGTGDSYHWDKAAGEWRLPLAST